MGRIKKEVVQFINLIAINYRPEFIFIFTVVYPFRAPVRKVNLLLLNPVAVHWLARIEPEKNKVSCR